MYHWNKATNIWDQVIVEGPMTDGLGWAKPQYYSTIQLADIDGDGQPELIGRGVQGLQMYDWNKATSLWDQVNVEGPMTDADGWDEPQSYLTIQTADVDGEGHFAIVGRASDGIQTWKWASAAGVAELRADMHAHALTMAGMLAATDDQPTPKPSAAPTNPPLAALTPVPTATDHPVAALTPAPAATNPPVVTPVPAATDPPSGYVDYVSTPELSDEQYAQPFRNFTPEELIAFSTRHPLVYEPGTNWNLLADELRDPRAGARKITEKNLNELLQQKVLGPLGLTNTSDPGTPAIPEPALHAYTSERRQTFNIPTGTPFYEESTYWNPSWTIAHGAIQTTNIYDPSATAVAIGTGTLLSPDSYQKMVTRDLIGQTTKVHGCLTCLPQRVGYTYGLGIVSSGNWLMQNPLFSGEAGSFAYLPSQKVAIAVAATFDPAPSTRRLAPTRTPPTSCGERLQRSWFRTTPHRYQRPGSSPGVVQPPFTTKGSPSCCKEVP